MQASVSTYDRLISLPGTDPAWFLEASRVNETLGDVVGEDIGLANVAGAIVAYRKSTDLDTHALQLDPKSTRARRALTNMQFKIGNAELDTDPAQALADLRISLQSYDALPADERAKLSNVRLRARLSARRRLFFPSLVSSRRPTRFSTRRSRPFSGLKRLNAEVKDIRALGDMRRILLDMVLNYENAADPALAEAPGDPRRNLLMARQLAEQEEAWI